LRLTFTVSNLFQSHFFKKSKALKKFSFPVADTRIFSSFGVILLFVLGVFTGLYVPASSALSTTTTPSQSASIQHRTLTSPHAQSYGWFGTSVAINGNIVVVGTLSENASGQMFAGHAYIFYGLLGTSRIITLTSPNAQYFGEIGFSDAFSRHIDAKA
jgi:FG-GAP repeat